MKMLIMFFTLLVTSVNAATTSGQDIQPDNFYPQVKIVTTLGDITIELNRSRAPITVDNFLWLTVNKEYDNTLFHRVINNFVIQGGGVTDKMKQKSDDNKIYNESGNGLRNDFGTIAMARETEPHTASRQFFFNVNESGNANLNPNPKRWGYTVFGEVIDGMGVLKKIMQTPTGYDSSNGWQDVPLTRVYLKQAILLPEWAKRGKL